MLDTPISAASQPIGRVIAVNGAQSTVDLSARAGTGETPTVGRFMGLTTAKAIIIGLITDVSEQPAQVAGSGQPFRKVAHLDLIGELLSRPSGAPRFQRGVTEYPNIGDGAAMLGERELRLVYGAADADHAHIGDLQQNTNIGVHIDIDNLVSRHFAILGATGVGKSSGVAIILQKILDTRPNLRVFLVDPHNEYSRCFGDKANVLNPRNLRLPFWLFNFEETIDAFFGGRPGVEDEVEEEAAIESAVEAIAAQDTAPDNVTEEDMAEGVVVEKDVAESESEVFGATNKVDKHVAEGQVA